MKRSLLAFIAIIGLLCSYSCTEPDPVYIYGNIAGKVTEEGSNNAIEGATIEISGIEQSVKTGSNGMFKFEKLPADNYTIYVSKDGYVADSKIITVVASQTTQSDFSLQKNLPEAAPSEVALTTVNASASIGLTNTRSADINFTIQTSQPWLSVSPTNGTIATKNKRIIKVTADYSSIDYGEYAESIVINVGQSSLSIPVQISYFRPSYIEITSPENGKVYSMGNVLPIEWNSNIGGSVKIELVRNGTVQRSIVTSVDNYTTSNHSWGIPSLAEDAYQILITSNESSSISATSGVFYLEEGPTPPVVSTGEVTTIASSSIIVTGAIEDFGKTYNNVTQYGHVYSTVNPNPTISDYKYNHGSTNQLMSFSTELINLKPNTRYYVRAYAENPKGIAYGTSVSVTTKTVDGNEPWQPTEPDENGVVDIGLSVKWAAYNVGATKPEEYGDYYAWGEVDTKVDYTEGNYIYSPKDSYSLVYSLPDGLKDVSGTKYDAATVNCGNDLRIPTKLELMELLENSELITCELNGIKGVRVIGPNGNSIFLPAAGWRDNYGLQAKGKSCNYWTSTLFEDYCCDQAYNLEGLNSSIGVFNRFRYWGLTIRPVQG